MSGSLPLESDDDQHCPAGFVRKCFCFGANGRGLLKISYTDGAKCQSSISAAIDGDVLRIHQPGFRCDWKGQNKGLVPAEITCHGAENEAASCDQQDLGRNRNLRRDDQYQRVEKDHCG